MIKPLLLGNRYFPTNLIQGPLAGYSNAPFRRLTWKYSQPAFSCTEMISSKAVVYQPKLSHQRYVKKDPEEGPLCFQLSGNDPEILAEAAKTVTDCGADLIDLNCGCPVKKIRRKGLGSSLLTNPTDLYKSITALKQNTSVPVSVKIRVQGVSDEKFNQEVAKVVTEAGADYLIVHGRHWTENYDTPCRYEEIKFFVNLMQIPVIGNGDIACIKSLKEMFATGCDGVMISRAGVGQPWLIKKLISEFNGEVFTAPSMTEIASIFLEHVDNLTQLLGNEKFAILQARKLAKYYARGIDHKIDFVNEIQDCVHLDKFKNICRRYFSD